MNTEEHDDLWQLLGKAREPKISPFFSRDVLRAIRQEQQEKPRFIGWLRRRWQVAAIGAGVLAAVAVATMQIAGTPDPVASAARVVSAGPDYQVITNLDELLDSEENSVWLESFAF